MTHHCHPAGCPVLMKVACRDEGMSILNILSKIIVIVLHGLNFLFSLQVFARQFYEKSKTTQ